MSHTSLPITVLGDDLVRSLLTYPEVIRLVRDAFTADGQGRATVLPVVGHSLNGGRYSIKTSHVRLEANQEVFGLKMGSYFPANAERGRPTHSAVMLLGDPWTGQPCALVAANAITEARTAAAGAVAADLLARPEAGVVALFGTGGQALAQLLALREVRPIREVRIWSRRSQQAEQFAAQLAWPGITVRAVENGQVACLGADVVITVTPAEAPILQRDWIRPGTHVNAMGSDAPGKQELDPYLVASAKLVVDRCSQSVTIGEMQHPLALGLMEQKNLYAELGELCTGLKPGRETPEEITVFDSTGVSFQDTAVAHYIVEQAQLQHLGHQLLLG